MKELSLHVLDIAQNSIKAGATQLQITLSRPERWLTITIEDDGHGMPPEFLATVTDPFTTTRTTRKVGMGLPLFRLAAEQTGGSLSVESHQATVERPEHGTKVTAVFDTQHLDCAPVGDMTSTILTLLQGNPELELTYIRREGTEEKLLSTVEMREVLGEEIPLNAPEVLAWARAFLEE